MAEMRREAEFFGDAELSLLYMARRLGDALRLEKLLAAGGVDYLVETGKYAGGFLIRRELTGAYFYVLPETLESARALLVEHRFKPYEPK